MTEPHGPPKPIPRPTIPDGHPNPFLGPHRAALAQLRLRCAQQLFDSDRDQPIDRRNVAAAEKEWQSLPLQFRLFVLVFSGIDDPEGVLARGWREMPLPERLVVGTCLRNLRQHLGYLFALIV